MQHVGIGEVKSYVPAGDATLQFFRGSLGDDPAVVEHRDLVGQLVGLVEILSGQQDRDAGRDELTDDLPHREAAARVQARRRLVEEDHARRSTSVIARSSRRRIPPE